MSASSLISPSSIGSLWEVGHNLYVNNVRSVSAMRAGSTTLVGSGVKKPIIMHDAVKKASSAVPSAGAITPAQLRSVYGIDQVDFGGIPGDGAGITIAIIIAYACPNALANANTFSAYYGLPLFNQGGNSPTFTRVGQTGGTPPTTQNAGWYGEACLDIQWSHAMAPMANIILVEAASASGANMYAAVDWARTHSGASVVSMSWSADENSIDLSSNQYFSTPAGHPGVTFLAATGDYGAYSNTGSSTIKPQYPAASPGVVAVGGTTLTRSGGTWVNETVWGNGTSSNTLGGAGGGISTIQSQPSYQVGNVNGISSTNRTIPDVSLDANPATGVFIVDTVNNPAATPWDGLWGGTSLACPIWAGIIAIANQGRMLAGLDSLNGMTQTLPMLYQMSASNFHDVTSGSIGPSPTYSATAGYDIASGRGTPIGNLVVDYLVTGGAVGGKVFQDNNSNSAVDGGEPGLPGVVIYNDINDNGAQDSASTYSASSGTINLAIPDNNVTGVSSTLNVAGAGTVSNIVLNFNITHTADVDLILYLTAPDNTEVIIVNRQGAAQNHFTNTTLNDSAVTSITSGAAPFTGTFKSWAYGLSKLDGKNINGNWKLRVADVDNRDNGTLINWSITITDSVSEKSTATDASGNYSMMLANGSQKLRQTVPANYIQTTPAAGAALTVSVNGDTAGQNFGDFPTLFTGTSGTENFYLRQDGASNLQIFTATSPIGSPTYVAPLAVLPALTFNLLGGEDFFALDLSNGPLHAAGVTVSAGGNSNDQLKVVGNSGGQIAAVSNTQVLPPAGGSLNISGFDSLTASNIAIDNSASIFTHLAIDATATVNVLNSGAARALWLKTLTIDTGGLLNLGNNDLVVDYTGGSSPMSAIEDMLKSAYQFGAWLGKGIGSTFTAGDPNYTLALFDNENAGVSAVDNVRGFDTSSHQQIIIKTTWVADINIDGKVDSNDAILFATFYTDGATGAHHQFGDLNYDGTINFNDAIYFSTTYNDSLPQIP